MKRALWKFMLGTIVAAATCHSLTARAAYPERPIHIVVPFLAGGSADLVARLIGERLAPRLGQQVIIENKAGAGGVLGADHVARAAPDGHTLLLTPPGPLTTNAVLVKSIPYDAEKAFAPVSLVVTLPNVLVAGQQHKGWAVKEMISQAKADHPSKITYGSQGVGTTGHLTGVLLGQQADLQLTHIAYKGFPPALTDVMAGRVDMMFVDTVNALPRIRDKSLVPVAVASSERFSLLPDVPTFVEAGYPGVISDTWFAVVAPAGTPLPVRERLSEEISTILKMPDVAQRLKHLGVQPVGNRPVELDTHIRKEFARWREVITKAGMAAE